MIELPVPIPVVTLLSVAGPMLLLRGACACSGDAKISTVLIATVR